MDENCSVCEAKPNTPCQEASTTKTLASSAVLNAVNLSSPSDSVPCREIA